MDESRDMLSSPDVCADTEAWWVVCLCARWCRTCNEYRPIFDGLAQAQPAAKFLWVDVEDEADCVGDVDVQTFPMLLIAEGAKAHFFGPVVPRAMALSQLLAHLQKQPCGAVGQASVDAQHILARIQAVCDGAVGLGGS